MFSQVWGGGGRHPLYKILPEWWYLWSVPSLVRGRVFGRGHPSRAQGNGGRVARVSGGGEASGWLVGYPKGYPLLPPPVAEDTLAVGMHPTGMLFCLSIAHKINCFVKIIEELLMVKFEVLGLVCFVIYIPGVRDSHIGLGFSIIFGKYRNYLLKLFERIFWCKISFMWVVKVRRLEGWTGTYLYICL